LVGELLGGVKLVAVIRHISKFVFGLRHSFASRGAFSRPLSHFRRGARPGGFEAGEHQADHDPDKDAELDRNQMCKFQIHLSKPLQAIKSYSFFSCEIFSETVRYNNLKIGRTARGSVLESRRLRGECPRAIK